MTALTAVTAVTALTALTACTTPPPPNPGNYALIPLTSGSSASLRGISAASPSVAWASGTGGTVLRTTDGGATWTARNVPRADSLDFRDIEAVDSLTAYVLSAGEDGRIYKTRDGGRTWSLQFQNKTKGAFFDCFDFWDERRGIVMSDPVDGRFLLLNTEDGTNWQEIETDALPIPHTGEAAFAASGTCLVAAGTSRVYLATGGGPEARVFVSTDGGDHWHVVTTPVPAGAASAGIFSLTFRDAQNGIAMGGDYQKPDGETVVAITSNGGKTWTTAGKTTYVSGAAVRNRTDVVVAVGTKGTRVSKDFGATWTTMDTLEYNAVQLAADGTGYAVGPRGRIAKLSIR